MEIKEYAELSISQRAQRVDELERQVAEARSELARCLVADAFARVRAQFPQAARFRARFRAGGFPLLTDVWDAEGNLLLPMVDRNAVLDHLDLRHSVGSLAVDAYGYDPKVYPWANAWNTQDITVEARLT